MTATLVDPPFSLGSADQGEFDFAVVSVFVDPLSTRWIAWNLFPDLRGTLASRPGELFLGRVGGSVDDYIDLTIVNPSAVRLTRTLDGNDALGEPQGTQSVIYGTAAAAPDVIRVNNFQELRLFNEAGSHNSIFTTAGVYEFQFSFQNIGGPASHPETWLLVETGPPPPPPPPAFAYTHFNEPAIGAVSYVPGLSGEELGFQTASTPSGGVNPTVGVRSTTASTSPVLVHSSVGATTTFDDVDLTQFDDPSVSLLVQVHNTTYEAGDFLHIWISDGVSALDLFNGQGVSNGSDPLDELAAGGFTEFSTDIPADWTHARLIIASFSNSSTGAEGFDFDDIAFRGVLVPEPATIMLAAIGTALGLIHFVKGMRSLRRRMESARNCSYAYPPARRIQFHPKDRPAREH